MKQNPEIFFPSHLVARYVKNPAYTIYSLLSLSVLGASQSCQILFEVAKGQIISKGLFGILGFFQKMNKQIRF